MLPYLIFWSYSRIFLYFCVQLKEFCHDNIQSFIGACAEPENVCYLMHWCSRGTLLVGVY